MMRARARIMKFAVMSPKEHSLVKGCWSPLG